MTSLYESNVTPITSSENILNLQFFIVNFSYWCIISKYPIGCIAMEIFCYIFCQVGSTNLNVHF